MELIKYYSVEEEVFAKETQMRLGRRLIGQLHGAE